MKGNLVITIGRQCGSNGKIIGQKIAEKLGVKCYDKELLNLAAKNSGLCAALTAPRKLPRSRWEWSRGSLARRAGS